MVTARFSNRLWKLAAVLAAGLAAVGTASASNMGFKMNKQIWAIGSGVTGLNLVSLPDRNPYLGAGGLSALCAALGLSSTGQITQFDGVGGINVFQCDQVQTFNLIPDRGVMITNTTNTTGIIVGSDIPGNGYPITRLGASPIGTNLFPFEYHGTAVTPQDVCVQCGLSGTASVKRFDAQNGTVLDHVCGQVALWNMVLGESLLIFEDQADRVCQPSHF